MYWWCSNGSLWWWWCRWFWLNFIFMMIVMFRNVVLDVILTREKDSWCSCEAFRNLKCWKARVRIHSRLWFIFSSFILKNYVKFSELTHKTQKHLKHVSYYGCLCAFWTSILARYDFFFSSASFFMSFRLTRQHRQQQQPEYRKEHKRDCWRVFGGWEREKKTNQGLENKKHHKKLGARR